MFKLLYVVQSYMSNEARQDYSSETDDDDDTIIHWDEEDEWEGDVLQDTEIEGVINKSHVREHVEPVLERWTNESRLETISGHVNNIIFLGIALILFDFFVGGGGGIGGTLLGLWSTVFIGVIVVGVAIKYVISDLQSDDMVGVVDIDEMTEIPLIIFTVFVMGTKKYEFGHSIWQLVLSDTGPTGASQQFDNPTGDIKTATVDKYKSYITLSFNGSVFIIILSLIHDIIFGSGVTQFVATDEWFGSGPSISELFSGWGGGVSVDPLTMVFLIPVALVIGVILALVVSVRQ